MSIYLSRKSVSKWGDTGTFSAALRLWQQGAVRRLDLGAEMIRADIWHANRITHTRFRLHTDGSVHTQCPCRIRQERGLICIHVIAAGLQIAWKTEDPVLERRHRIAARRERDEICGELGEDYLPRCLAPAGEEPTTRLRLRLEAEWQQGLETAQTVEISCQAITGDTKRQLDKLPTTRALCLSEADLELLYIIEDLAGVDHTPGLLHLDHARFCSLLAELARLELDVAVLGQAGTLPVGAEPLLPALEGRVNRATGTCQIIHRVEFTPPVSTLISKRRAWACSASDGFRPLEAILPEALRPAYRPGGLELSRQRVAGIVQHLLPQLESQFLIDCDLAPEDFEISEGTPTFEVELSGSPELLATRVWCRYGETRVPADRPATEPLHGMPVTDKPFAYVTRSPAQEAAGLQAFATAMGEPPERRRFADTHGAERTMRRVATATGFAETNDWQIIHTGLIGNYISGADWIAPRITMESTTDPGWFSLSMGYAFKDGTAVPATLVEEALRLNHSLLQVAGRSGLIDVSQMRTVEAFCAEVSDITASGIARVSDIHAGYLTESLGDQRHVAFEAPPAWYENASRQTGHLELANIELNEFLEKTMRPYQRDGVRWLRFMEKGGYCGILADEMGLGKTIQALAWIQLKRLSATADGLPSLVVCPTSLVENWAAEAKRFTPGLRCHMVRGSRRHAEWDKIKESDLVITSYALLRRDIKLYQDTFFAIAVLDEAQHIKNHSTLNAQAAKLVRAAHRLVLTGTPIENSVNDLWSIMDYLMPRYLGTHAQFRERVERPVSTGGEPAGQALLRLRRKLQPFMLRRLKATVAKDLPPKIQRVAMCHLSAEQERLYHRLEREYREQLHDLVDQQGAGRSQFTVLKTLLRLRQACCHPSLVLKDQHPEEAATLEEASRSGKLELFLELLNEAMDGGQRVLVFSQFVEMLKLLRRTLDARGIRYSYLDGSTVNRQDRVNEFNSDDSIPVFLVSLKAGGSGLNLTGASVVIHFDPWWNPAVEDQATDRAHRIGQERTVYSIKLVTQGTVEERVIDLQDKKRRLIDAAVADQDAMVQSLTWEDIRSLLAL
jgi:superfamily II DNA or RNA helicase